MYLWDVLCMLFRLLWIVIMLSLCGSIMILCRYVIVVVLIVF